MNTSTENSIKTTKTPIAWNGSKLNIKIKKLVSWAKIPSQAYSHDAGFDVYATEVITLNPMERKSVGTGLAIEIPPGYFGRISPRSGFALKNGLDVLGGILDSTFRGEIRVILINLNPVETNVDSSFFGARNKISITTDTAIAQIIIQKCETAEFEEVTQLSTSERNQKGFGSSDNNNMRKIKRIKS